MGQELYLWHAGTTRMPVSKFPLPRMCPKSGHKRIPRENMWWFLSKSSFKGIFCELRLIHVAGWQQKSQSTLANRFENQVSRNGTKRNELACCHKAPRSDRCQTA